MFTEALTFITIAQVGVSAMAADTVAEAALPTHSIVEGTVDMDPALLDGARGIVEGCGAYAPINPDLTYTIELPARRCILWALVFKPTLGVATGVGSGVNQVPPPQAHRTHAMAGPDGSEWLPWSEHVSRAQNSVVNAERACDSGQLPIKGAECDSFLVAPMREELQWLTELTPTVNAWMKTPAPQVE